MKRQQILVWAMLVAAVPCRAASTFDDIAFWVGAGPNHAALALDWNGATTDDEALVWGYRWDGAATGADMLLDVLAADPRLFAMVSTPDPNFGIGVYGLGYDLDNDGEFSASTVPSFNSDGVFIGGPSDGGVPGDPEDLYVEGWTTGYWHYGLRSAGADWATSFVGPTSRTLTDGDWDSYAFAVTLNADEFATNLVAAPAPLLPGDFNVDGTVDAADYTVWRDGLNQQGGFTPDDYDTWASAYGDLRAAAYGAAPAGRSVPEPSVFVLAAMSFLTTIPHRDRRDL